MNTLSKLVAMATTVILLNIGAVRAVETVVAPNEVCVYEFMDYVGGHKCFKLYPNMRYRLVPNVGVLEDKIRSVQVGSDVGVTLFRHKTFGGNWVSKWEHDRFLDEDELGGEISSIIVTQRKGDFSYLPGVQTTTGGTKPKYLKFFPLPERSNEFEARYSDLGFYSDKPVAIDIYGEVEVTLYEHDNFKGDPLTLPGAGYEYHQYPEHFNLKFFEFSNKVSSLVVRVPNPIKKPIKVPITEIHAPPPRGGESTGDAHRAPPAPKYGTPKATLPKPSNDTGQGQLPISADDLVWHCCAEPPIRCDFRLPPFDGKPKPRGTPCTCPGGHPGHACE